ncbi:MAG: helix-turn-helix transcriptional regulator [Pseudobdellovibrionaceae bacterium]
MNRKERLIIASILSMIVIMVGFDLVSDSKDGFVGWHVFAEGTIAAVSLFGVFYILRNIALVKNQLEKNLDKFRDYQKEAEVWKSKSRKYIDGLANAIDQQLSKWNLSVAEKEVAFLLLKGMSLKEIAEIRNTAEKTARTQSMAIYSKAGLSGRSELAAFFMEDLLAPQQLDKNNPVDK